MDKKFDHFFNNLKYAANVNLTFGFILKNIKDGGLRYFYSQENNTLLDRSKPLCTRDDLAKLKDFLNKTDVIESCGQETINTKWTFYKLTNLRVFAASLKDVGMCCKDAVLPKPVLKQCTINCFTFEENTRQPFNDNLYLFRAVALGLNGNQQRLVEKTTKIFKLFMGRMDRFSPSQFQEVHVNDIPIVKDVLFLNILLCDIDIVEGNSIGELAWRSVQKHENAVRLLR